MLHQKNYQHFVELILFMFVCVRHVRATWLSPTNSPIQLLGIFQDESEVTVSVHARAMFKAAILLSQQYNMTVAGHPIEWRAAYTGGTVINALDLTCQAISSSNIVGIVGPSLSREAHVIAAFAKTIGIPVISYSATDPDLSNRNAYPVFYRTVPSDHAATRSIAQLFIRYNWTSCIIIYQNDQFGSGGAKALSQVFSSVGLIVRELIEFDIATGTIQGNLKVRLTSSPARIVLVWAESEYTSLIVQHALDHDILGPQFTWILSQSIPLNTINETLHSKMIGMLTVEPTIGSVVDAPVNTTLLNAAYAIWQREEPSTFPGASKVDDYALFAFDATWSLIEAVYKICANATENSSCLSLIGPAYCFDRRLMNSNALINALSVSEFLGVSGPIEFNGNVTDRVLGTYYVAQNVQPSSDGLDYVSILERSEPGNWKVYSRTSVILWPGSSLNPPSGRAVLAGVRLRIGVIESTPFTTSLNVVDQAGQSSTKLIGYVPDLINLLQRKMGFIPEIMMAPPNQTYSGMVRSVANGVYDIVIGDVTITSARRELVGFSNAIFDNSLRIIIRKEPGADVDLLSYFKPFTFGLWMMLLSACVYAAILICVLERNVNEALHNRSIPSSVCMCIWYSIGTLVGYGADFHATTGAGRIVTIGLYILSLVFVATYTANLASDLTVSKSKNIISGLDDLKSGRVPFSRFGIRLGTAGEDYYLREISGGSRNFYPLKSRKDLYEKLLSRVIDGSFMDTGVAEYVTNNIYCNLTLAGSDFDKSSFGIVIPKQWVYAQDLDVNILSLRESGALDDMKRRWFQASTCATAVDKSTGIELDAMSGLFLTFAIICVLSLIPYVYDQRHIIKNRLLRLARRKTLPVQPIIHVPRRSRQAF
jgi:ABC-type amino acid transport substrate-binding protein/ABC-type branched-subunit amino acid transport system substrate-binding protein